MGRLVVLFPRGTKQRWSPILVNMCILSWFQASREKVNKPVKKESKDNVREKDREKSGAATPPRLGAAKLHKVREKYKITCKYIIWLVGVREINLI